MWQRSINSESAARLLSNAGSRIGGSSSTGGGSGGCGGGSSSSSNGITGVGGGGLVTPPRGRGMERGGRGRGARGTPTQYFMRGISCGDEEGGDTTGRGGNMREMAPPGITMR